MVLIVLAPEYKHAQTPAHIHRHVCDTIYIAHITPPPPPSTVILSNEATALMFAYACVYECVCVYKSAVFINTIFTFTLDFIVISPFYIGVWMSDEGGAVPWNFQHPFYYSVRPESDLRWLIFGALTFGGRAMFLWIRHFCYQNVMRRRKLSSNWITFVPWL